MTFSQVKEMAERAQRISEEYPGWLVSFSSFELASASFAPMNSSKNTESTEDTDEQKPPSPPFCVPEPRPRNGQCTAGKEQLCIAHDGNVYPCPSWVMAGRSAMGNVLRNSIAEIWRDSTKWKQSRGGWDYGDIAVCRDCPHLSTCEIGRMCRIPAIEWFGTPYGPPPGCIAHFRQVGIPEQTVRSFIKDIALPDRQADRDLKDLLEEAQLAVGCSEASTIVSDHV
jgi:radical SAM protein with 4Fe4S-binding SPASM domain